MKLYYNTPAETWLQALPLGNGHLGAMVFGGDAGKFELTENTFWSGRQRSKTVPPQAKKAMDETRRLLREGKNNQAQKAFEDGYVSDESAFGTQLPLGTLTICIKQKAQNISRSLNLITGVSQEQLTYNSFIKRTCFISHPHKLMCIQMNSPHIMPEIEIGLTAEFVFDKTLTKNSIEFWCKAREGFHSDFSCGVDAFCRLEIKTDGKVFVKNDSLILTGAKFLELYFTAKTNFECDAPKQICTSRLQNTNLCFDTLLKQHIKDFESYMKKCSLSLNSKTNSKITTDTELKEYKNGFEHLHIEEALFQMGRYLLLITSREDSQVPAALQGILNDNLACRMGWANDIHIDVNTQMNYSHAETTGLSKCTAPLYEYTKNKLAVDGAIAAKQLYGANGWGANTVTNLFGFAVPKANKPRWAMSHTCGGWLALHIWQHYLYTNDIAFLAQYFETLLGSAQFILEMMEPHPKTKELVANPSYSPENAFYKDGVLTALCLGATFDRNVAVSVFNAVIKAAKVLNITDNDTVKNLIEALEKTPALRKGRLGQLMEWYEDYDEPEPTHRHISHLLCLHPFEEISFYKNPQEIAWAQTSLARRTQEPDVAAKVCWCAAQTVSHYALLHNARQAAIFHRLSIEHLTAPNLLMPHANLGIYEMDGNTGYTASVVDMLMQSGEDWIDILPALPPYWNSGSIGELTAKGNVSVNIEWDKNCLKRAIFCSKTACCKTIYYNGKHKNVVFEKNIPFTLTSI